MASTVACDNCGRKVLTKEALSCGSCGATFCPRDFHSHENKYGSHIGDGCVHPKQEA